ncbi:MAG: restriction endonuclease [Chloroflexota bacterium]|nr:restriction endonuclease [Chloroflexota bacterium]
MPSTLFSQSYLEAGLRETEEYQQISPQILSHFGQDLRAPYNAFIRSYQASNEAQIEDALIRPVLNALGWSYLPQQPIPVSGKTPDYMLFADDDARAAFTGAGDISHYPLAPAEAKAWGTDLDQRAGTLSPSAQIQDYLRQFWQSTSGRVKWGILTNGETWRLYRATGTGPDGKFHQTQDAWFELKLGECVSDAGRQQRRQFLLFFHRDAFRVGDDGFCFLDRALAGAADYVQTVVNTLTDAVFEVVYPQLIEAFYQAAPDADPDTIQEASLTLLYRLLFLMYAEDRRLLPVGNERYDQVSLRALRRTMLDRFAANEPFTSRVPVYWLRLQELFEWIDDGQADIPLPAYNGGLFNRHRPELLTRVQLSDARLTSIINSLGAAAVNGSAEKVLVNFRDLAVEQLGTLYERLLERRPVIRDGQVSAQLQPYARKDSGSYYTPPELVRLIVEQTLGPLVAEREERFRELAVSLASDTRDFDPRRRELTAADPAESVLQLKTLDPAMGSGHFLVDALNYLTGEIDRLAGLGAEVATWLPDNDPYVSPLETRIAGIRKELQRQAAAGGWEVGAESLSDRAIIRRMVLKRCIYGVDLNPLAVELAKMSLWLHSFTVGAPLSFLDHHLRCGDALVGGWLAQTAEDIQTAGGAFANYVFSGMTAAAQGIRAIEEIDDADISEVKESEELFRAMEQTTAPIRRTLNFFAGLRWMAAGNSNRPLSLRQPRQLRGQIGEQHAAGVQWWSSQDHNALISLAQNGPDGLSEADRQVDGFDFTGFGHFIALWRETRQLAEERRMFHWELAFPGVFDGWNPRTGGFDAVIGNPPWERVKLQEVEWFAPETRRPAIAHATPASRRRAMIAQLENDGDPLHADYAHALDLADTMLQYGRAGGDYPMLGGGDANLYRLFVERATAAAHPDGIVALLTPSGIYGDQSAAKFFGKLTDEKRLLALYDFENRRGPDASQFFPDVDSRFKFCTMLMGGAQRTSDELPAGFLLHAPPGDTEPERLITLQPSDFALVNPNTRTAPIFLSSRDADIVLDIYRNHPVFDAENKNFESPVVRNLALGHKTHASRDVLAREQLIE